jgi:hypothetical protein
MGVSKKQRATSNEWKDFYSLLIAHHSLLKRQATVNGVSKEIRGGLLWLP